MITVRAAFFSALGDAMEASSSVMFVTGDMGFGVVEDIQRRFPMQFVNAGVAEQNMTGLATGLALTGQTVFTYSIANFPTFRCLEQIRNDVCLHNANVKIVSTGNGFAYGILGTTHHATEDIAILRSLPNLTILNPADPVETAFATKAAVAIDGPVYIRVGKGGEQPIVPVRTELRVGNPVELRQGQDATILATGSGVALSLHAARVLEHKGINVRVLSVHTIRPFDSPGLKQAVFGAKALVTVEEHSVVGGLGSGIAELLAESPRGQKPAFRRIGIPLNFTGRVGGLEDLRRGCGLTPEAIADHVESLLRNLEGEYAVA